VHVSIRLLARPAHSYYLSHMRKLLLLLFLLPLFATAQEKQLLKLLNDELQKQSKFQFKSPAFSDDTIKIIQSFTLSDDKVLSLKIRQHQPHLDGYIDWLQEVPLKKILTIDKDMNVIFRANGDDVRSTVTRFTKGEEPKTF